MLELRGYIVRKGEKRPEKIQPGMYTTYSTFLLLRLSRPIFCDGCLPLDASLWWARFRDFFLRTFVEDVCIIEGKSVLEGNSCWSRLSGGRLGGADSTRLSCVQLPRQPVPVSSLLVSFICRTGK